MQAQIDPKRPLGEVPRRQRRAVAKPLADYAANGSKRDRAMAETYRTGAYSMQTIGEYFGVSRMTVSRAVKRHEAVNVTCETWPHSSVFRNRASALRQPPRLCIQFPSKGIRHIGAAA